MFQNVRFCPLMQSEKENFFRLVHYLQYTSPLKNVFYHRIANRNTMHFLCGIAAPKGSDTYKFTLLGVVISLTYLGIQAPLPFFSFA